MSGRERAEQDDLRARAAARVEKKNDSTTIAAKSATLAAAIAS